jgi:glycosyltransferase involved in cell wall biosynthesis
MNSKYEPAFSVVIPCFNESKSLPELISRCEKVAKKGFGEFVIVDNGSTDSTQQVVENLNFESKYIKIFRIKNNIGYGNGILFGLKNCSAPVVGWTHADLQTNPEDIIRGVKLLNSSENSFVKGVRKGRPVSDQLFTFAMSIFETLLMRKKFWDINAQPTLFNSSLLNNWTSPPNDFSLDLYAYYQARQAKFKIIRFPVNFGARKFGISSWNKNFFSRIKFIKRTLLYSFELRRNLT